MGAVLAAVDTAKGRDLMKKSMDTSAWIARFEQRLALKVVAAVRMKML